MNTYIKQFTGIVCGALLLFAAGCSDVADEITTLEVSRLFSPTKLETRIVNQTGMNLNWTAVANADSYNVEIYDNATFEGSPLRTVSLTYSQLPYLFTGFDGETEYTVRVQAIGEGIAESKWSTATFKTDPEQIFKAIDLEELAAHEVTLRWPAGEMATHITLTPGDITIPVTANHIAAGAITLTGLKDNTKYTAKLMNEHKTRGTAIFTTLIDLNGAKAVYPEDDLVAILDAASDGDEFVLFPGTYTLGSYAVKKSISLSGYLENDKPVVFGRFTFGADIESLSLKTLTMTGADPAGVEAKIINAFEASSACTVGKLTVTGCEFRDYSRAIIYNNAKANFGDVLISGCLFTDIPGDGGDGIDFRGGSLKSFIVENTTFDTGFRAFVRMQASCDMAFRNCTFYRVANFNNSNNSGLFRNSGGGTLEVKKCLFVETGVAGTTYGNWCKNADNMKATPTYADNYYYNCHNLWAGLYTDPAQCNAKEANPGFKNAEAGDFTLTNDDLIAWGIGDPRWR